MKTLDERIKARSDETIELQKQVEFIEKQITLLQQRRESLAIAYHRADAALAELVEMKREAEPAEEGT